MPETMPKYHEMLKFRWDAVLAVRKAVKSGLFKADITADTKREVLETLGKEILEVYSRGAEGALPEFRLVMDERVGDMMGGYIRDTSTIALNKPSLVTFLHELAHHIQWHRDGVVREDYARGFSLGLYFKACPKLFQKAVETGKILYSDRTWFPPQEEAAAQLPQGA